jgi:hypothetical protein
MSNWWDGLHPDLVTKTNAVLAAMSAKGYPMRPYQGLRTADTQHTLWLQGRPGGPPGRIVTNCDGIVKKSRHQSASDGLGHAVDICFTGADPFGIKQPWALFGATVQAQGLVWGGTFHSPIDLDHAELP